MPDKNIADLHIHTTYSDGTDPPDKIVQLAKSQGIKIISITDHDSIEGLKSAREAAAAFNIELINGVEISCDYKEAKIEILGYFIDDTYPPLLELLENMKISREKRAFKILEKLKKIANITLDPDELIAIVGEGVAGRPHIATLLLKYGYVSSITEAFLKYLGDGKACAVPRKKTSIKEVIRIITEAGGIPVLAHPGLIAKYHYKSIIYDLIPVGLLGIEVFYDYRYRSAALIENLKMIALKEGLFITGGSDYHGANKNEKYIGCTGTPLKHIQKMKFYLKSLKTPFSYI